MRPKKPITIQDLGRLGGLARARKHSKRQIQRWGKLGGRPRSKERLKRKSPRQHSGG